MLCHVSPSLSRAPLDRATGKHRPAFLSCDSSAAGAGATGAGAGAKAPAERRKGAEKPTWLHRLLIKEASEVYEARQVRRPTCQLGLPRPGHHDLLRLDPLHEPFRGPGPLRTARQEGQVRRTFVHVGRGLLDSNGAREDLYLKLERASVHAFFLKKLRMASQMLAGAMRLGAFRASSHGL